MEKPPAKAFGEVLLELRAQKEMRQESLALGAATERSHISSLGRAEKGPALTTIFRLSQALSISTGVVVTQVEHKNKAAKR